MTIKVNQKNDRIDQPTVVLNGHLVTMVDGAKSLAIHAADTTITTDDIVSEDDGMSYRNKEEYVYQGDVTVTITPDSSFTANSYSKRDITGTVGDTADIIGKTQDSIDSVNKNSETYYTVNGKDPIRTKANLYTGPFLVRKNLTGSDNIILKVKTFYRGSSSVTKTVEFRIMREDDSKV
jgi:hypothetical protein